MGKLALVAIPAGAHLHPISAHLCLELVSGLPEGKPQKRLPQDKLQRQVSSREAVRGRVEVLDRLREHGVKGRLHKHCSAVRGVDPLSFQQGNKKDWELRR